MKEKIHFKKWTPFDKVWVPIVYGLTVFGAISTAYDIKNKKNPVGPILGTIATTLMARAHHRNARDEARFLRKNKELD